jgi:hypothetical protein
VSCDVVPGNDGGPPSFNTKVEVITLEKFMYCIVQKLNTMNLPGFDLKGFPESLAHDVALRFQFAVCGESQKSIEIKSSCPATWWQHFKRDVLKCKKIRVKEETTTIDPRILYPKMKVSFPDEENVIHLVRRTDTTELWRKV